ncbi:MAG: hypothetical protein AB7N76_12990 [Planctomycetota bacterium]
MQINFARRTLELRVWLLGAPLDDALAALGPHARRCGGAVGGAVPGSFADPRHPEMATDPQGRLYAGPSTNRLRLELVISRDPRGCDGVLLTPEHADAAAQVLVALGLSPGTVALVVIAPTGAAGQGVQRALAREDAPVVRADVREGLRALLHELLHRLNERYCSCALELPHEGRLDLDRPLARVCARDSRSRRPLPVHAPSEP